MADVLAWVAGSGVVQGVIIGAALAFLTVVVVLNAVARAIAASENGWSTIRECGRPGNGILVRAACAKALPVVTVLEEAAYWTTTTDASGRRLSGRHDYVLRFPAGQLPPNGAFWSLTATDVVGYMVPNAIGRSGIGDRSRLVERADGSVDIRLGHRAPEGREPNWLPVPAGRFKLMLRAYLPGPAVLDGTYRVPPVVRAQ